MIKLNLKRANLFRSSKHFYIEPEFAGEKRVDKIGIQLIQYNKDGYHENNDVSFDLDFEFVPENVSWLNFHGIHDVDLIKKLSEKIQAHPLLVKDILNTNVRTKVEEYEEHLFLVVKSPTESGDNVFEIEQISFILGANYIISLQEKVGDHFEHLRERLRANMGIVRKKGPDFFLFLLIDGIIENYFEIMSGFESQLDTLESQIKKSPEPIHLAELENIKKILIELSRKSRPMLETLNILSNTQPVFIKKGNLRFYSQLKDKLYSLIEVIESYTQKADALDNIFYSIQGHRMNEIMKVLTIIASIFIPLTFLAGIYGMNFEHIPELHYEYAYFILLGMMFVIIIAMIIFFRKKRWL